MRPRISLAGQLLALQLGIVCMVLIGVAAVSLAQSKADFSRTEGRTARSVAEAMAASTSLREALENQRLLGRGELDYRTTADQTVYIRTVAENTRSVSGSTSVIVVGSDGIVIASPDPDQLAKPLDLPESSLVSRRGWVGEAEHDGEKFVAAQVPVLSDNPQSLGEVVGVVVVSRRQPSLLDDLRSAMPNLLTYLGIASALGVLGSLLVARRVKRQTLGLEPIEITGLVEHRDALLHGIKEGVIALDRQQTVTLINDEAISLLDLSPDAVGRTLRELKLGVPLLDVLSGKTGGSDLAVPVGDRVLILNRMPVTSRGRPLGSVTTLRDRTELITLQHKLDAVQQATDALRAQAHEFSNRLHTISGLVELGEYGEVTGYIHRITARHAELTGSVTSRIADPAVAALLVAKGSVAAEQGIELRIAPTSSLGHIDERLSADVATVVGNLVDNALDALGAGMPGWAEVEVREADEEVVVTVRDCGPGVSPELAEDVFERGFSTKAGDPGRPRGIGLALVRLVCLRRDGDVRVANDGGAVFVARLPKYAGTAS
ncbi:sensor histidine kinase [Dactylosporangium roseum]|uniref:sensor histidine kinase n=1 Tax=Dactylosporangium roseum TaxID=47989 RepID=UPI0021B4A865|nr:sensor histidine kinase [Dactylosporangium roseum]